MSISRKQAENIVKVLSEGLPYIQRFYGKKIIVKYGGAAMAKTDLKRGFARDVALMKLVGMEPIIIHGGGPQIDRELDKAGIEKKFISGNRVTNKTAIKIVEKVLANQVNKEIVELIKSFGASAIGMTSRNSNIINASKLDRDSENRLGLVGKVDLIRVSPIKKELKKGNIPVIAPIGIDNKGDFLNINADTIAGEVSKAFKAEKLILLTDVQGIKDKRGKLLSKISPKKAKKILKEGIVKDGMRPKLLSALDAISNNVTSAHIIDGRVPHVVLLEILTKEGVGTLISSK